MHVSREAGWLGLLLALACYVKPAASIGLLRINTERVHVLQQHKGLVAAPDHEHEHGHAAEEHHEKQDASSWPWETTEDHGHGSSSGGHEVEEDAHHGRDHGHQEKPEPAAVLVATMLLGMVAWIMTLFYFVNWPAPHVRQATWDTLSAMITIFCGVLIFSCLKQAMVDFAGENYGDHHSPPDMHALVLSFGRFLILFVVLQCLLYGYRKRPMEVKYVGLVGSHVVGFAAIDWLGSTMQLPVISTSMLNCVLALLGCFLILMLFYHPLALARRKYASEDDDFQEECDEFDGEAVALVVGLLISLVLRKAITGDLPPVHGSPKSKTTWEITTLFAVSVVGGLSVAIGAYAYQKLPGESSYTVKRTAFIIRECASMAMGWCLLYTGYWTFYQRTHNEDGVGGAMTMRVIMALVFSAITLFAIIFLDSLADRTDEKYKESCRSLLLTFSLLMGLSWEACFSQAVQDLGLFLEVNSHDDLGFLGMGIFTSTLVHTLLSLSLCAIVLPAWAWYILPTTSTCKHFSHHGGDSDKEVFEVWNSCK